MFGLKLGTEVSEVDHRVGGGGFGVFVTFQGGDIANRLTAFKISISFPVDHDSEIGVVISLVYTKTNPDWFAILSDALVDQCTHSRLLASDDDGDSAPTMPAPVSEPNTETYYCLARDFPCEGGADFVHVCHFSARLGYQTFCIPEADSEVLRFYTKDYCGPCVGSGTLGSFGSSLHL